MYDHMLESSRWDDSNKWSNIGFGEEIGITELRICSLSGALISALMSEVLLYYSFSCELTEEDAKMIRVSLFGLVKFYIVKEITHEELSSLLNFMLVCLDENMVSKC